MDCPDFNFYDFTDITQVEQCIKDYELYFVECGLGSKEAHEKATAIVREQIYKEVGDGGSDI